MKKNRIKIIIDKPINQVFEFTINPKNTSLWISSIVEEVAEYPPSLNTIYKNRGDNYQWSSYKVIELKNDEVFTLSDLEGDYHVRYTYKPLDNAQTELEYYEWVENGDLEIPFTIDVLENLKHIIEGL